MYLRKDEREAIVVLGKELNQDSSLQEDSKRCIEELVRLFNVNQNAEIILSGYKSYRNLGVPGKTEAEAMMDYAVSLGIPMERIQKEERSMDPVGSAYFVDSIVFGMENVGGITVVDIDYNIERTRFVFNKMFSGRFQIRFKPAKSEISGEERKKISEGEQETSKLMGLLFSGTVDGDRLHMRYMIEQTHPLYAKNLETVPSTVWSAWGALGIGENYVVSLRGMNSAQQQWKAKRKI